MKPMRTEMIERYLRARGHRYFRGHHDADYFFILTVGHERLHIHIEIPPADRHSVTVRATPSCFYPAAESARLRSFAGKWNKESRPTRAVVHESCDQNRIGLEEFADLADSTIRSAVALFAEMPTAATEPAPVRRLGTRRKDAA